MALGASAAHYVVCGGVLCCNDKKKSLLKASPHEWNESRTIWSINGVMRSQWCNVFLFVFWLFCFFVCRRLRHMLALCEVIPHQQHYSRNINPGELHLSSQWNGADIVFCIYYILQISMNLTWIWMLVFYKCVALALRYFSFFSLVQILTHCDFFMSLIV